VCVCVHVAPEIGMGAEKRGRVPAGQLSDGYAGVHRRGEGTKAFVLLSTGQWKEI
jgi:hypothetical protein